jgi:hypothetical protein
MSQTGQEQPSSGRSSSRPGRMTAVMRAVSQQAGPKILRIGVVQGGKVIDERLVKQRISVTIGPSEKAMFVVPTSKLPPTFRLFELIGTDYYLNYIDGMSGRVALKTGISDLSALSAQAKAVSAGGLKFNRVRLTEESRGKIVVGETTFLFQFVAPPPVQPKPQLPVSVQKGAAGDIDWFTTIIASFSFLLHFFFVALVYSDWMDPIVDDEYALVRLQERAKSLPPPPPVAIATAPETESSAATTADADKGAEKATSPGKSAGKGGAPGPGKGEDKGAGAADAKAAEIASALAALDVQTLGALGGAVATEGVLGSSDVPAGLLDDAGRSAMGSGTGDPSGLKGLGGMGSDSVRPGEGGGGKGLAGIGDRGQAGGPGGGAETAGSAKAVKGPQGSAIVGGAGVAGGAVANAGAAVSRMRGRFRACYQAGLDANPELAGSVTLVAKIGPNGAVTGVSGGGGALSPIVGCLKSVVSGGGFSPPDNGVGATISIPITFVVQK